MSYDPGTTPSAEQVRALRDRLGLTQAGFGALVYCRPRTVQDWERGIAHMAPGLWELALIKAERTHGA